MGPAAWAAVGRAVAAAIAGGIFLGRGGLVRLVAEQVSAAILERDFQVAEAMLRDMRRNHRDQFDEFLVKYGKDLPPEFLDELWK